MRNLTIPVIFSIFLSLFLVSCRQDGRKIRGRDGGDLSKLIDSLHPTFAIFFERRADSDYREATSVGDPFDIEAMRKRVSKEDLKFFFGDENVDGVLILNETSSAEDGKRHGVAHQIRTVVDGKVSVAVDGSNLTVNVRELLDAIRSLQSNGRRSEIDRTIR